MLKDEHTAIESYQWLLHHMSQIKKEMKEHGDSNYARISNCNPKLLITNKP